MKIWSASISNGAMTNKKFPGRTLARVLMDAMFVEKSVMIFAVLIQQNPIFSDDSVLDSSIE